MTCEPPEYGQSRFLFTQPPDGYAPAIAWARRHDRPPKRSPRRRSQAWGAWLRRAHLARLAEQRAERQNAFARLAATGGEQGYLGESAIRYARRRRP
jgi:hypothetical protein